jgi:site-specific recombinase XerD
MKPPLPLFDNLDHINQANPSVCLPDTYNAQDYQKALEFLKCYTGSQGTYNSYRREIERLLHWCFLVAKKSLNELKRQDIEDYIHFCQKPPKSWIGTKQSPRFIIKEGIRIPNAEWRPFMATVSKAAYKKGERADSKQYSLSQEAIGDIFAILGSFYNYMLQEEYLYMNLVALIRQKSKFIRKNQGPQKIRRLSDVQWQHVLNTAKEMADIHPDLHERTLFIMSALYAMYLRISELAANKRWSPTMNNFYRDSENNWWFTTVGKGNKQRQIAVSDSMLDALKRWRKHLGLPSLPTPADQSPLLPKSLGQGHITDTTYIRKIIQGCFDHAINSLNSIGLHEEAESLSEATVHWLRHTGISDDVKRRPREHVRDDAGHGSGAITDKYIDIQLRERHRSAKNKPILME